MYDNGYKISGKKVGCDGIWAEFGMLLRFNRGDSAKVLVVGMPRSPVVNTLLTPFYGLAGANIEAFGTCG